MCGIVGILKLDPRETVEVARLAAMRDVLRHRGPDGAGLWARGPVGLAHRRLAIVDVAGGHQPMADAAGTTWITYNGEIYNHAELRADLEARGHRYRTRSDTETILHLYAEVGERCVERLRGMFAFALWDGPRRKLLLARDRLGIKPLYYAWSDDELLFASEIKALLAAGLRPALVRELVPELLANRYLAGEETLFSGVRKVMPGCRLVWQAGGAFRQTRYWRPPAPEPDAGGSLAEHGAGLRERLRQVVHGHLMSDVPLGVFLSGGLDSSGLAALMAAGAREPVRTFSVGFAAPEADELPYARLVAGAIGARHREVVVTPAEFFAALPRLVWHEDEPLAFPSSVPLYFVSRLARDHVKVVLTGEGADELFLGYNRYRVTAWNERLAGALAAVAGEVARARLRRLTRHLPARRYTSRSFLALAPDPRGLYYENFAVFAEERLRALLRDDALLARDPYGEALRLFAEAPGGTLDRMSQADVQTYLVELLMKQDQMSMAASIESRVPYLDHVLVEHVLRLPARLKLRGLTTKAVLRAALRDVVPPAVLARRKLGFPVPLGPWLRGPFWPLVQEFVLSPRAAARELFRPEELRRLAGEHRQGAARHDDRLWLLINLEIWQRVFLDGEAPGDVGAAAA